MKAAYRHIAPVATVQGSGGKRGELRTRARSAARVSSSAQAGDIIVSRTVKDLVAGSGIEFEDFGMHHLKGVPDPGQLYRVSG
jgi:class 3 adenylate cyclase